MSHSLITLNLNGDQIATLDRTVADLEGQLQGLVALTNEIRRFAPKMGAKSEHFCRQTLHAMKLYPNVVPPSIDVADAHADLDALDRLRPLFQRLHRLSERAADSELALGADVMSAALDGYRVLKAVGRSEGLETLRKDLGQRFVKTPRPAAEPAAA